MKKYIRHNKGSVPNGFRRILFVFFITTYSVASAIDPSMDRKIVRFIVDPSITVETNTGYDDIFSGNMLKNLVISAKRHQDALMYIAEQMARYDDEVTSADVDEFKSSLSYYLNLDDSMIEMLIKSSTKMAIVKKTQDLANHLDAMFGSVCPKQEYLDEFSKTYVVQCKMRARDIRDINRE